MTIYVFFDTALQRINVNYHDITVKKHQ